MAINIEAVIRLIEAAEMVAIDEVADFIASDAKARAPIRKVFREARGHRRKFRPLTPLERNLAIRRAIAYQGYANTNSRHFRVEIRRRGSANSLANSRALRMTPGIGTIRRIGGRRVFTPGPALQSGSPLFARLTSRGRYEARSGRAIHEEVLASGATRLHIGGALKASIGNEGAVNTGQGVEAKVSAAIRYAKFVEFPTTHNAAQPFLIPALQDARGRLRKAVAAEIGKALRGG